MGLLPKKRCACVSLTAVIGVALVAVGVGLITVFNNLIHSEIKDQIPLKVGSESYKNWIKPAVPIYFQVWMYNVVNRDEVLSGKRPVVQQMGPYTYREGRQKENITFHENGTVFYREIRTFTFDRSLSVGPETDSFHALNLPMVTIAEMIHQKFNSSIVEGLLNAAFETAGMTLFKNLTVHGLMWGYYDPSLKKLKDLIGDIPFIGKKYAKQIPTSFGLFMGQNGADDGLYEIYSGNGEKSLDHFGEVISWNEATSLSWWTSKSANSINGSDGTIYPPFINQDTKYLFSSDLCRSLGMDYAYDVTNRGIPMKRFIAPHILFGNVTVNPSNAGFCTPANNCLPSGLLNVSNCREGAPIVMSMPNFLGCDPDIINAIEGVHPNQEDFQSYLDIEPLTGVVMNAGKRLQINVILDKKFGLSSVLKNLNKRIYFPVMWLNESALIDPADASKFKSEVLDKITLTDAVKYGLIALGGFIIIVVLILLVKWRREQTKHQPEDRKPLYNRHTQEKEHDPATNGNVVT